LGKFTAPPDLLAEVGDHFSAVRERGIRKGRRRKGKGGYGRGGKKGIGLKRVVWIRPCIAAAPSIVGSM